MLLYQALASGILRILKTNGKYKKGMKGMVETGQD